jgi:hypothetical protein
VVTANESNSWLDRLAQIATPTRVVLLAAGLRMALALLAYGLSGDLECFHAPDTHSYLAPAESLWREGTFARDGLPEIVRTPGYPLLFVPAVASGHVEAVALLLQIGLSCATVFLVYRIAMHLLCDEKWTRLCALTAALEPVSILYSCKLLSETLFTSLTTLAVYLAVRYLQCERAGTGQASTRWLVAIALALAASTFVRPIAYFLPWCLAGGTLIFRWGALLARPVVESPRFLQSNTAGQVKRGTQARLALQMAVLLVLAVGPVLAWQWRNQVVADYRRFSATEDLNLYFYNAAAVAARDRGVLLSQVQAEWGYLRPEVFSELHPEQLHWTRAERYRFLHDKAVRTIRERPWTYALVHLSGIPPLLFGGGVIEYATLLGLSPSITSAPQSLGGSSRICLSVSALFAAGMALCWLLVLASLADRQFRGRLEVKMLCVVLLYFALLSAGPAGNHRMRHPMMPSALVMATAGWRYIARRRERIGNSTEEFKTAGALGAAEVVLPSRAA